MLDGMRQAFIRLSEQYVQLDQVAQNQANSQTPGFRGGDAGVRQGHFQQWLQASQGQQSHTGIGTDVALPLDSYLQVQTAQGTAYTRRGDLGVDTQHRLVTGAGDVVLDSTGAPILVPAGELRIGGDGMVMSGARPIAKLARFKLGQVQEVSGSLFTPAGAQQPVPDVRPVAVGQLESSNVDATLEQTRLIAINNRSRVYSQVIQIQDSTLDKAFQQLGRGH